MIGTPRSFALATLLTVWSCLPQAFAVTSSKTASSTLVVPSSASTVQSSLPPAAPSASPVSTKNPADLVNLFVGTTNGGHVFPGSFYRTCRANSAYYLGQARLCHTEWSRSGWTQTHLAMCVFTELLTANLTSCVSCSMRVTMQTQYTMLPGSLNCTTMVLVVLVRALLSGNNH